MREEGRKGTVERHPLAVRLAHWGVAVSALALLFSGFGQLPMFKRYNIVKLPGMGWTDDFEIQLILHYIAAAAFGAAVLFHLVYHLRRRELAALPRRGDVGESVRIIRAMLSGGPEPPSAKFLAEQRLAYAAIGGVSLVLLLTGMIKSAKNLGPVNLDPTLLTAVTLVHTAAAMAFLGLVVAHLAAFLIRANRPLLPSMVTGRVSRAYAQHRHPLWSIPGAAPRDVVSGAPPVPAAADDDEAERTDIEEGERVAAA